MNHEPDELYRALDRHYRRQIERGPERWSPADTVLALMLVAVICWFVGG